MLCIRSALTFLLLLACAAASFGQEVIRGASNPGFSFTPRYERGIPPNLFVDLGFTDGNSNGILEAQEEAVLQLTITNRGKGPAQGLNITVEDSAYDPEFKIEDLQTISYVMPGKSVDVAIPITAGLNVKSAEHRLKINVSEHFGYDMDPAYLVLNSFEYQKPKIEFAGLEIVDYGQGTGAIIEDGLLQAGELVKIKIVVQNTGQNVAYDTHYELVSRDDNIFIENPVGKLGDLKIGEVKEFWVAVSPNKRVESGGALPLILSVKERHQYGNLNYLQLPIYLNQKPPETAIVQVKADLEKLTRQVARFEYTSEKFTANVGKLIDVNRVEKLNYTRKHSVAVVLGIEKYVSLPPAPFAANDARLVEKYFKDRLGIEQVVTYTDEEVSGFAFDDIFNAEYGELQKAVLKGQTDLFVFYSGHGVPDKSGERIFLFPSDGKIERLESQGYDINRLYENLEKLGARSVTVFLDACFSGASKASEKIAMENLVAMKGVGIKPKLRQPWLNSDANFLVFNSSSGDETSLGFDQAQTGLFTYYVCAGLQGYADQDGNRSITSGELHQYVSENVIKTSRKILGQQTPEFYGQGDVVLLQY